MLVQKGDIILTSFKGTDLAVRIMNDIDKSRGGDGVVYAHALVAESDKYCLETVFSGIRVVPIEDVLKHSRVKIIRYKHRDSRRVEDGLSIVRAMYRYKAKYGFSRLFKLAVGFVTRNYSWAMKDKRISNSVCSSLPGLVYWYAYGVEIGGKGWNVLKPDDIDDASKDNSNWEVVVEIRR